MKKHLDKTISLSHGSGGKLTHELIDELFVTHFQNDILKDQADSALLQVNRENLAFTTDSFVVDPIFFPGGNIGKLAVCGTVNDLAVSGARPLWLSASFIIEEGFEMDQLEKIVRSMADEAKVAGVQIVTGDTKVVDHGKCDKVFINTTGIGMLNPKMTHISTAEHVMPGDKIIVNGPIGEHGVAILAARESLGFELQIDSDCASLNHLIGKMTAGTDGIRFMRDATRGGLATVLCELASRKNLGIQLDELLIPVREKVKGTCEIFGFDPLYMANEGRVVVVASAEVADELIRIMQSDPLGKKSAVIGEVVSDHSEQVVLQTEVGGRRIIDMLAGEQLPRIC